MGKTMENYQGFRYMLGPGLTTKRIQYSDVRRLDMAYSRLRLGRNGLNYNTLYHSGADPSCHIAQMNWNHRAFLIGMP